MPSLWFGQCDPHRSPLERFGMLERCRFPGFDDKIISMYARAVRTRGHFPSDESAMKRVFLVLRLVAEKWRMPAREWMAAKAQFAIVFEDRFTPQ